MLVMTKKTNIKNLYIFSYSQLLQDFDSKIIIATINNIQRLQLRARLNSQRNIVVYAVILTEKEVDIINKQWESDMCNEQLKQQLDELGAQRV